MNSANLFKAFKIQIRVVFALILRESAVRYGKTQLGYLWALLTPIIMIFLQVSIFTLIGRHPDLGNDLFLFFATGYLPFILWRHVTQQTQNALSANQALMFYPIVNYLDFFLARFILELAKNIIVWLFIFCFIYLKGVEFSIKSILELATLIFSIGIFGLGVGMINAGFIKLVPAYANIFAALSMPFFIMSGVFYTAASLEPSIRSFLLIFPTLQFSEWMRTIFYTGFNSSYFDIFYILIIVLSTLFFGLTLIVLTLDKNDK
jgi:capsular polysaccharide transport system permease protein